MRHLDANEVAIAYGLTDRSLRLRVRQTRFGEFWVSIEDDVGVIEVAPPEEAVVRVKMVRERLRTHTATGLRK